MAALPSNHLLPTPPDDPVELMFHGFGQQMNDDQYESCRIPAQDVTYKQVLSAFLAQVGSSTGPHPDLVLLKEVANRVLTERHPVSARVAFIEGIASLILWPTRQPYWGDAQYGYLAYCQYIFKGRTQEYLQGPRPSLTAAQISDLRDIDYLPNLLTLSRRCEYCTTARSILVCGGCRLRIDRHETICSAYCSRDCQRLDWPRHKVACVNRRGLIRTVTMMKEFLLSLELKSTALEPWHSMDHEHMSLLIEGPRTLQAMQGHFFLHKFSPVAFKTVRHAMMALHDELAPKFLSILGPLKEWFWAGMCQDIQEVTVLIKNANCPLVRFCVQGKATSTALRPHTVYRVTLFSGEVFAVDFTGGRFGWAEPCMLWKHFVERRVATILHVTRTPALRYHSQLQWQRGYLPQAAAANFHREVLRCLTNNVRASMGQRGGLAGVVRNRLMGAYMVEECRTVDVILNRMQARISGTIRAVRDMDPRIGRMYLARPGYEIRVTISPRSFGIVRRA
ncbi:hypothetical protein F4677DRAFT_218626 [Hypoxylon crocopeplum]|nr:hypothetical protein F4677DRAFT_218626 [Hypoxylon crocopeplum]